MLRTLHGRLALVLLVLLVPLGGLFVLSTLYTARRYHQEISQKVNADLAQRLVQDSNLMVGSSIDSSAFNAVAKSLAMISPGVELYILDPQGTILGASVPAEKLKRQAVALGPLERFLSAAASFPISGTDPRSQRRQKVFSASPIPAQGSIEGYLYVLLADEAQDSLSQMIQSSYVLSLSIWSTLALLGLVFVAGWLIFTLLTRRLKRLALAMTAFKDSDFSAQDLLKPVKRPPGDEVEELELVFGDMAQRISQQLEAIKQADVLRRELITNVSHDLRTPLAALQGYLETLEIKEGNLSPQQQREYLRIASQHSVRLGKLIAELFDLAQLDSRAISPCLEAFPIAELGQDILQKFQLSAQRKGVSLKLVAPARLPFVMADIGLIERVFTNLIDNAIRYTPSGGEVCLKLAVSGSELVIELTDTGRGIAPEDLPHIFDRFYRVDKHDPQASEGAGLGLAISKRILELHGCSIEAKSEAQKGSSFCFSLPIAQP